MIALAQEIGVQGVYLPVFDRVLRGFQCLAQYLAAIHTAGAYIPAGAAKQVVLKPFQHQ